MSAKMSQSFADLGHSEILQLLWGVGTRMKIQQLLLSGSVRKGLYLD